MILPYPISANRYWRTFRGMTVASKEAKAYKAQVAAIAKSSGCLKLSGEVALHVTLIPKQNQDGSASKVLIDLDNCLKVLFDALQGVAYDNDKQIKRIVAEYADEPIMGGGVSVEIVPYG